MSAQVMEDEFSTPESSNKKNSSAIGYVRALCASFGVLAIGEHRAQVHVAGALVSKNSPFQKESISHNGNVEPTKTERYPDGQCATKANRVAVVGGYVPRLVYVGSG